MLSRVGGESLGFQAKLGSRTDPQCYIIEPDFLVCCSVDLVKVKSVQLFYFI